MRCHRKCCFLIGMVFLMLLLPGCSGNKAKSEADIINDIVANDDYCSNYNLEVESYTIISRLTSTERMTDDIEILLTAVCDEFSYSTTYSVNYLLYDNGWILNDIDCKSWSVTPLYCSITELDANSVALNATAELSLDYSECNLFDSVLNLDSCTNEFVYHAVREEGYTKTVDTFNVLFRFNPNRGGWYLDDVTIDYGVEDWNVLGTWNYHNSRSDMELTIHQIANETIQVEYDFSYECPVDSFYGYYMESFNFKSDGVETFDLHERNQEDSIYFLPFDILLDGSYPTISITKYEGVCFDGYPYSPDDLFIFSFNGDYSVPENNYVWNDYISLSELSPIWRIGSSELYTYTGRGVADKLGNTYHDVYWYMNKDDPNQTKAETYDLYGQYRYLSGIVFPSIFSDLEDEGFFKVYGDGALLSEYYVAYFTEDRCFEEFQVDVSGIRELTIEFSGNYCIDPSVTWWSGLSSKEAAIYVADLKLLK